MILTWIQTDFRSCPFHLIVVGVVSEYETGSDPSIDSMMSFSESVRGLYCNEESAMLKYSHNLEIQEIFFVAGWMRIEEQKS